MQMKTNRERVNRGRVLNMESIEIVGPFDFNDASVDTLAGSILNDGNQDIVLDLRKSLYLTSPGIACIIKVLKRVRTAGGALYVHGATRDMIELLRLTKLGAFIHFV